MNIMHNPKLVMKLFLLFNLIGLSSVLLTYTNN